MQSLFNVGVTNIGAEFAHGFYYPFPLSVVLLPSPSHITKHLACHILRNTGQAEIIIDHYSGIVFVLIQP